MGERNLYLCTPDRSDLVEFVTACIEGGVDVVQLREKNLDARSVIQRARLVGDVCRSAGVPFLVNDRPDLALAAGADGVHVGQDDCPPEVARRIMGPEALIGLSTHASDQLAAAAEEPVDYVSAGPVTPTPTKPGRPGVGLGYVAHAAASSTRPVFVTGGISPDTVGAVAAAGASRFVVVRWLTEAKDPLEAARALRRAVDEVVA